MKKERLSNFELLRIIAMVLIVMHHSIIHANINSGEISLVNDFFDSAFASFGKLGVVIFVLITGYFSYKSKFNLKKLILLWFEVAFYSIGIYLIFALTKNVNFGIKEFIKTPLVLTTNQMWFFTCYFGLMLLSPLINAAISCMGKKTHLIVIAVGTITLCCFNALNFIVYFNELIYFCFLYIIGAFINKYDVKIKTKVLLPTIFITLIVNFGFAFAKNKLFNTNSLNDLKSVFMLIVAVALILSFKNIKPFTNKYINYISSTTFGIYLIHDNPLVRGVIWDNIFRVPTMAEKSLFIYVMYMIMVVFVTFIACLSIDMIRKLIAKPLTKLFDKGIEGMSKLKIIEITKNKIDVLVEKI